MYCANENQKKLCVMKKDVHLPGSIFGGYKNLFIQAEPHARAENHS
jgi:hypothetical protein